MTRPADYTPSNHLTMNKLSKRSYPPLTPKEAIRRCRFYLDQIEGFFFEPGEKPDRREIPEEE